MTPTRPTRPRRRFALVTISTVVLGLLAACGGGDDETATTSTTRRSTTTTSSAPALTGGAPLTGLPTDEAAKTRPALVVKIDNAPLARPQEGLNQADIVVEEAVEGGISRLFTIFHSSLPAEVGPVRSARSTDIALASALNKPLFDYSGANRDFQQLISQAPLVNVGISAMPGAHYRKSGRPGLYNVWARVPALYSRAEQAGGPPPPWFEYRTDAEAAGGEDVQRFTMEFRGRVVTAIEWRWHAESKTWRRVQNGTAHVDVGGAPIDPVNVVVQFTNYRDTGHRDQSGEPVPEAELIGEGEAWVFTAGRVIKGRWIKPDAATPTRFVDANGATIRLTPGRTWLELPKPGMASIG